MGRRLAWIAVLIAAVCGIVIGGMALPWFLLVGAPPPLLALVFIGLALAAWAALARTRRPVLVRVGAALGITLALTAGRGAQFWRQSADTRAPGDLAALPMQLLFVAAFVLLFYGSVILALTAFRAALSRPKDGRLEHAPHLR